MALYVISVGGSLIVPEEIDTEFLGSFKQFIIRRIEKGDEFILVAGGGKTARKYQMSAAEVSGLDNEEKDWLGIHSSRLNGHLLRSVFKLYANPKLVTDYEEDLKDFNGTFKGKILVGAGWKPGWSTDYDAVLMAEKFEARAVINLSNMSYVYSQDPNVNPEAKRYDNISWKEFRELIGNVWYPGINVPFDPVASYESEKAGLTVAVMNGKNLDNLNEYLEGREFKGTIISDNE